MNMFSKNQMGGTVVVTVDQAWGSSGKGALNSWIADKNQFDWAVDSFFTNAGHFTTLDDGTRILTQMLPSAFVNRNAKLYINAGAAVCLETLFAELKMLDDMGYQVSDRLVIHPHTNVIVQEDKDEEKRVLGIKTTSTMKGCGAAVARKSMRQGKVAKDYEELHRWIDPDVTMKLIKDISSGANVIFEVAQGCMLDLNHAQFPYTTSRQVHWPQIIADSGISPVAVSDVVINCRTHPIRINNKNAVTGNHCYSGDFWGAEEIDWPTVALEAGYASYEEFAAKYEKSILTSVTKLPRRVARYSHDMARYVDAMSGGTMTPNIVSYSLNFLNFIDKEIDGAKTEEELLTSKVKAWLKNEFFAAIPNAKLKWVRTGILHSQIVEFPDGLDKSKL